MRISPITQYNNSTSFGAIPLAKYGYLNNKSKDVVVYQLEKKDINYLKYILDNIEKFFVKHEIEDNSTKQVLAESLNAGIKILERGTEAEPKARVLLATSEEEPSAILIGNTLKVDKKGRLHYSSRKNHSSNETELDWLATWNKKILGEGKVIVCEYFSTVLEDKFEQIYVRSEVPEKSFARDFYKKMGFKPLSKKQREIQRENDNNYLIGDFDEMEDKIIPMKITARNIKRTLRIRSKELIRKVFKDRCSVELPVKEL